MELDDLKIKLKSKLESEHDVKTMADLQKAIHAKTKSITGQLKRSLWIEMIFSVVMAVGLLWVAAITMLQGLRIYFIIFSIICIGFFFVLLLLLKKVNRLSCTTSPVKENLEKIISIISEYIKRYFQFSMGLIPVCIILSTWLGMHEPAENAARINDYLPFTFSNKTNAWTFLLFFFTGFTAFMYYFTKWYLKKLYGNYLDKLKQQLKELENA